MKQVSKITARVACLAAIVLLLSGGLHAAFPTPDTEVLPFGQSWRYFNPQNLNQDPFNNLEAIDFDFEWFLPTFTEPDLTVDDGGPVTLSWQGPEPAPIGYDTINVFGALATDIGQPVSGERYTTYLRGVPFIRPAGVPTNGPFVMEFGADDGFAMYLDGVEVDLDINDPNQKRYNCCQDIGDIPIPQNFPPTYLDRSLAVGNEDVLFTRTLGDFSLGAGSHMIAVSLHQQSTTSSDTGFDMRIYVPGNGRPWGGDFSGDWDDPTNWQIDPADSAQEFAVFDSYNAPHTIWTNTAKTLDGVQFADDNTYNIAGTGSINLQGSNRNASLNVLSADPSDPNIVTAGQHEFQVRVNLNNDTDALIDDGSSITFNNRLNLNGRTLAKTGFGDLLVRNNDNSGDGTINVSEGNLGGSGTVSGDVNVSGGGIAPSGTVTPAAVASTLTITGDATVSAGDVTLRVYGNGNGDAISGNSSGTIALTAGANINVVVDPAYTPANNDSFVAFLDWETINAAGATIATPGWTLSGGTLTFGDVPPPAGCDFNADMMCDIADIDMLTAEIASGGNNLALDVNSDGVISIADRDAWLASAATQNGKGAPYLLGDANLDGAVNAQDLNELGQRWQLADNAWSHGDFNADGNVNAQDLNELGQRWQQMIPMPAAASVPEPSALSLLVIAALGLLGRRRR